MGTGLVSIAKPSGTTITDGPFYKYIQTAYRCPRLTRRLPEIGFSPFDLHNGINNQQSVKKFPFATGSYITISGNGWYRNLVFSLHADFGVFQEKCLLRQTKAEARSAGLEINTIIGRPCFQIYKPILNPLSSVYYQNLM